ncbi:hydrolase TatD [Candidatus Falkowbacteria bacterium CG10_big_fil_rev_8_21_14_0_10_43_10]|uniref:Hydrolase TatD n=1 Tax=Candidatus Falkowbacteria bacterium CG10_big_fil_rev_8_21_14_0_10_43_10 TaxID=1974567 RepID=A0A2H0V4V0_9BACT|nr:MAG: hydrolase TatD [Candidatus Falkowbacteria bacterium CG10_big_fil_rev_8_21_14_0_10_43_10]
MFIDTHAHLNFQAYAKDVDNVIRRSLDEQIEIIIPSTEQKTSKRAVEIAEKYDCGVYAAIGLHPVHLQDQEFEEEGRKVKMKGERFDYGFYKKLAESKKVVAIGEVGLDYYYLPEERLRENKQLQQFTLLQQLELAYESNKPAIIHWREAHRDLLPLLDKFYKNKKKRPEGRGVIHDFFGDWDLAWQYFNFGFLISFTGNITFSPKKSISRTAYLDRDELIRKCPLNKFMVETDSPFMSPVPYRGQRNEPVRVIETARKIADLKHISLESVAQATTENAQTLFNLK